MVFSIPTRMGLSADDAADVFQATFAALYQNLDRIDQPQTLPKWLGVTASREALRLKRLQASKLGEPLGALEEIIESEEASAETTAMAAAEADQLWQSVANLGTRCQGLLTRLYASESSYDDISRELSIPVGAIGPTRARCLEKLKQILQKNGFFS
jgi:RNA polymerase sigma factor (sigma-70 family)